MRWVTLWMCMWALGLLAGCRDGDGAPLDMAMDLAMPVAIDCTTQPDCLACCDAQNQSGALDFDSLLQSCACQADSCAGACAQTVCGSSVGIEASCRACLAANDGGVCASEVSSCQETAGACGAFKRCVDRCP